MTFAASRLERAPLARAAVAQGFNQARPIDVPGPLRRAVAVVADVLAAAAIALCLPFVILAVGLPIALCLRLVLWLGGLLWGGA